MNRKRISLPIILALSVLISVIGNISIPAEINFEADALRFTESAPDEAVTEKVSMTGTLTRRLNGTRIFDGILTIGRKQVECSMDLRTPILREYRGSRLQSIGMFLIIDGKFDAAAIKMTASPAEYVVWGMTPEEFLAQEMR